MASTKVYNKARDVYDAALDRVRWLFDEFDNIVAAVSGGKDSLVIYHLCLKVAREKGRLPLKVMFLDQECEWQATVDHIDDLMQHPDVQPYWYQVPFRLFNATSQIDQWLDVWGEESKDKWVRPKVSYSIKENTYGEDRFQGMFNAILNKDHPDGSVIVGGVRCEETPSRYVALTYNPTYKWVTWGKKVSPKNRKFIFYPIYDWSYRDVWKFILDEGLPYNRIYDVQYQNGASLNDMRVSNLHHETAVHALFYLQVAEPDTYERIVQRIGGIDMAGKMGKEDFFQRSLPPMFANWWEYRDYLCEKLIADDKIKQKFRRKFDDFDEVLEGMGVKFAKACVQSILTNDWEMIKIANLKNRPENLDYSKDGRKRQRERLAREAAIATQKSGD